MSIKILIADDHQLFREGLVNLLADSTGIEVIAEAQDGKETITLAKKFKPDIVIMDIGMPIMNGLQATTALQKDHPEIKVIALSMHSDRDYIKSMLEAGASGYLFKNCSYHQLIEAIKSVYSGKKYLSDDITEVVINDYLHHESDVTPSDTVLSERESEILKLYAEGKSSREIADLLFVSVKTIGTHKQNILNKLGLKTIPDMVKYALKSGMIPLE
ncbi:MAG: response regulator transcription factor [Bacteroidetes bacterium]|nr:response regulator transcription factor [Bacteroidota bacterium]